MHFKNNVYDDYINSIGDMHFKNKFNIEKKEYFKIHEKLLNSGLVISKTYFSIRKTNVDGTKYIRNENLTQDIITFEILCNILKLNKIDFLPLIDEFNKSQRNKYVYDMYHTISLGKLGYEYLMNNYNIEFIRKTTNKKTPDIKINNISVDSKVREEIDVDSRFHDYFKITKFKTGHYVLPVNAFNEFSGDIQKSMSSRGEDGFEQADAIFFDLTYRWGKIPQNISYLEPVKPLKNSVIFFVSIHSHTKTRLRYIWAHALWNKKINDFIRNDEDKITWI